jgi:predicted site-specific integrase-resolvase
MTTVTTAPGGNTEKRLHKVSTAMARLEVSRATIYRMITRGQLELVKISQGASRITSESLERAMQGVHGD